jgi:hypothetical protein
MQIETDWLSAPRSIKGQDQIGSQAPCELTYSQLLPGITNVTDRARYFSFYPWITWSLDTRYKSANESEYIELYRKADCLYTLIAAYESTLSGHTKHADAMIGRLSLLPALNKLQAGSILRLSDYATQDEVKQRYFKNRMGGLGQYYVGSLAELGICFKSPSGPWIKYTEEFGRVIAEAVDAKLPSTKFWETVDRDTITIEDLSSLRDFSPHLLPEIAEEQSILIDVFFARKKYIETVGDDPKADQRRLTLALLLDLGKHMTPDDMGQISEWTFRPAVYAASLPGGIPWNVPVALQETRTLWSIYERSDLLSTASLIIFAASLKQIRKEASDNAVLYESVESFASYFAKSPEMTKNLFRLSGATFGDIVESVHTSGPRLADWEDSRHEFTVEDRLLDEWRREDRSSEYFVAEALQVLALLAAREPSFPSAYGNLLIQEAELKAYPINLVSFQDRARKWASLDLASVTFDMISWCLNTHITVALRKLWQTRTSSFHLRPGENGLQVVGDIPPPTRTLPRIKQSLRILEDLGAFSSHAKEDGSLAITALGISLLEESLA